VLLRTIIGLIAKRQGSVEVFGVDFDRIDDNARRAVERRWGVLFQQGALFSSLTALENVQFPMRENLSLSDRLLREVALAKLAMVGLTPRDASKMPAELSGGMTKRVALARALALDPELVFLDEPTSGLGLTVFMVTHDLETLRTVCDRVAALADGKVIAIGDMADMLRSPHPWMQAYFQGKRAHVLARSPAIMGA
jgi:phospholipid/cholesterol/gamma-HCH transport system ATP-binding protein